MITWVNECLTAFCSKDFEKGEEILNANYPKKLYKYTPLNEQTIENLTTETIYMSTLDNLNDYYEFYPSFQFETYLFRSILEVIEELKKDSIIFSQDELVQIERSLDRFLTFKELFLKKGYVFNFRKEDIENEFLLGTDEKINDIKKILRFKSFSEINTSTVMWSHYGSCHKGICIEYDPRELGKEQTILKVSYSDNRNDITNINQLDDTEVDYNIFKTLLLKAKDWEYEREWRLICFLNESTSEAIIIQSPKPTAIYLGSNFHLNDEALRKQLIDFAKEQEIPLHNMKIDPMEFKMVVK